MRPFAYGWMLCTALIAVPTFGGEPDFAMLPGDTVAVMHIRGADLMKSDSMKEYRELIAKAGVDVITAYEKRFTPAPSSVDRTTVFLRLSDKGEPLVLLHQTLTEPLAKDKFLKTSLPNAKTVRAKLGSYFVSQEGDMAYALLDAKLMLFGPVDAVDSYLNRSYMPASPLAEVLKEQVPKHQIFLAANVEALPERLVSQMRQNRDIPPPAQPLVLFSQVHLGIEFATTSMLRMKVVYPNEAARLKADVALKDLAKIGRQELAKLKPEMMQKVLGDGKEAPLSQLPDATMGLLAVAAINYADEILADPPIKSVGTALAFETKIPGSMTTYLGVAPVAVGLLIPAVQKVRGAANRTSSMSNLRQISIAMMNIVVADEAYPPAAICDKAGKPLLSWRVALLPYLEQQALYRQFKLDEPWDSENNKKLIPLMPAVYRTTIQPAPPGETYYRIFTGPKAVFNTPKSLKIEQILDGTSNTVLVMETAESTIWTKPGEFENDPKLPLPKMPNWYGGKVLVAMADGFVRLVKIAQPEGRWRSAIDPKDNAPLGLED